MSFQPVTIIYFWKKELLRDVEPTAAVDFQACLVIPKFQFGKEICNYFTGMLMAFPWEKHRKSATRFLIKEKLFSFAWDRAKCTSGPPPMFSSCPSSAKLVAVFPTPRRL